MAWRNIFGELKRRRVYRVSAAYVIVAFAVLQGADIVLPALGIGAWAMRILVVLAILGLPTAAALAWIFDITPGGLERTDRRASGGQASPPVSRRAAVAGVLGVAVAFLLVGAAAWLAFRRGPAVAASAESESTAPAASVAVLPCIDVSADRDHEYFGDGITEEIIGELARFDGLKVISRTSVAALKGSQLTLPQIADTLRVRHVLECSIQRSGSRIRVHAKLIDPRSDTPVWSDAYNRELVDVVSMQEDIARHVGSALLTRLPEVRPRTPTSRTPHPAAYDAYLRGTAARRQLSRPGLLAAIAAFEEAIAADSTFALAYSGLAQAHVGWTLFGYRGGLDPYERIAEAFALADRAIALDSTSAEAFAVRAHAGLRAWLPSEVVLDDIDRAVQLAPSSAEIRLLRGVALAFAGRFDEAVRETDAAITLDPLAVGHHDFRAMSLILARRFEDALRAARLARALEPDFPNPRRQEARALLLLGHLDECLRTELAPYFALRAMCLHSAGRISEASALIDSLTTVIRQPAAELPLHVGGMAADIAEYHAWIGDAGGTLEWLHRSVESSPIAQFLVHETGTYDRIRNDLRFSTGFGRIRRDIRQRIDAMRGERERQSG
jgi:adenylate cyclase